jgi:hypothetical protein
MALTKDAINRITPTPIIGSFALHNIVICQLNIRAYVRKLIWSSFQAPCHRSGNCVAILCCIA